MTRFAGNRLGRGSCVRGQGMGGEILPRRVARGAAAVTCRLGNIQQLRQSFGSRRGERRWGARVLVLALPYEALVLILARASMAAGRSAGVFTEE